LASIQGELATFAEANKAQYEENKAELRGNVKGQKDLLETIHKLLSQRQGVKEGGGGVDEEALQYVMDRHSRKVMAGMNEQFETLQELAKEGDARADAQAA